MVENAVQRRLAAILVADVVAFSRMMEANEAGTLAALKQRRKAVLEPVVKAHVGRIVKLMGDGVLIEFGSAVNAVAAAVELQHKMLEENAGLADAERVVLRIGINLGDVIGEGSDIYGDGVNIAARLEPLAEPGSICISAKVHDEVRGKLPVAFEDMGDQAVKGIARPIRTYRVLASRQEATAPHSPASLMLPDKPSIAVLPFQNMSGDPEQEYFADGIVDDIVTALSRIKWLFVIARNSSLIYKGRAVDVRQVGRELGVRYLLEGGVRKAGDRIRINAQLIEAETGAHLWAEKFDGAIENVFDLQDRITEQVVGIVEPSLQKSEIERSRHKHPGSLDAYDLYLRALPFVAAHMPPQALTAIPLLQQALTLEPDYLAAHALIAWCHELCFIRAGYNAADKTSALRHAEAVITGRTDDAASLAIAGFVMILLSGNDGTRREAALGAIHRALQVNPSCATALYLGAQASAIAGRTQDAVTFAKHALRLSPFDPLRFEAHMALGEVALQERRYRDAAACFGQAGQANGNFSTPYFFQAIALALDNQHTAAKALVARGLEIELTFGVRQFFEHGLAPALLDELVEGSRLLGLPE